MRVNLIQKFLLLNLFWHMAIGLYFGYWFSERLVNSVTRLNSTNLADDLRLRTERRFQIHFFDDPPEHPGNLEQVHEQIGRQAAGFLSEEIYPVQTLWNHEQAVWSNDPSLIGQTIKGSESVIESLNRGRESAELKTNRYSLLWMWNALTNEEAIINDASSHIQILIPIRFERDTIVQSAKDGILRSERLKDQILSGDSGEEIVAGVLELKKSPRAILSRTVKEVRSVWKRIGIIYMLSNIVLFGLFKSAFNTIQRQSRELREQERLSNLGKMASYLAHEIRNPLFIIRGSAQTIEETSEAENASRKLARYVIDEVDRLNNMVQDLLGLVKPRLAPTRKPTSLSKAIMDSAERSLKQAPKMDLVLQLDPSHDLVWFNRDQLIQVFTNLFRNARDACSGQGAILVESRTLSEGMLQVRVTDDGPGIPEDHLDSIFDPFFSGKENGTGLGLAIVRHLVTGNNATIDAVKPTGTGACFILTLRLAPKGAAELLEEEEEETPAPARVKDSK